MQVTADLYDWDWVKTANNSEEFFEVLLEDENAGKHILSCHKLLKWSDSHNQYFEAYEAIEWIVKNSDASISQSIKNDLFPLVSENSFIDELNLSIASEGCYYASISPEKVKEMCEASKSIDMESICKLLREKDETQLFSSINGIDGFSDYIKQWQDLLKIAGDKEMGIIGHMG